MERRRLVSAVITCVVASWVIFIFAKSSLADSVIPALQSKCEAEANKFVAQHPHFFDGFDWMRRGFPPFPFGEAIPPLPPSAYRDPESGITFYVESDGRHVAAIDNRGNLVWVRNPFVDVDACPYRSAHPYIAWIGAAGGYPEYAIIGSFKPEPDAKANARIVKELDALPLRALRHLKRPKNGSRFIGLWFNSSQQGYLNIANGDFYEMGQN